MTQENWYIIFIIMCIFYLPSVAGAGIFTIAELAKLNIISAIIFGIFTGVLVIPMVLVYRKSFV